MADDFYDAFAYAMNQRGHKARKEDDAARQRRSKENDAIATMRAVPLQPGQMLILNPNGDAHILDRSEWAVV